MTLAPLALSGALLGVGFVRAKLTGGDMHELAEAKFVVLMMIIILPTVATTVCSAFSCDGELNS